MLINVAPLDRGLRAAAGLALFASPILNFATFPISVLGILPIATAIIGVCPLYSLLGVTTCTRKSYQHIKNVDLGQPKSRAATV